MNPEAREVFKRILDKAKTDPLTDHEIGFLRARQAYLKASQREYVDKYLKADKNEGKRMEKKAQRKVEADEVVADEANRTTHPAEKREQLPYKVLQNENKKLGKRYVGVSRKELEEAIA